MSQSQLDQMSAFGQAPTNLSSQQNLNPKMIKESCSTEDIPQHDSSQESIDEVHHGHHHIHQNVIVSVSFFFEFLLFFAQLEILYQNVALF